MNLNLKKRLDSLEHRINPVRQRLVVTVHESQSESARNMIERWKAGEEVEGIDAPPYQGGECQYFFKVYVATRKRKNGVECVHKHSD